MIEQHYKVSQVARTLGRSTQFVREMVRAGEFPGAALVGGVFVIPESGVRRFLLARQVVMPEQKQEVAA